MRLRIMGVYTGSSVLGVIIPSVALGYRGIVPSMGLSHKLRVLSWLHGGSGGKTGNACILLPPSQALGTGKHVFFIQIWPPHHKHTCIHQLSQLSQQAFPHHPLPVGVSFPLFRGCLGGGSGFLTFVSPLTCGTGSC